MLYHLGACFWGRCQSLLRNDYLDGLTIAFEAVCRVRSSETKLSSTGLARKGGEGFLDKAGAFESHKSNRLS